MPLYDTHLERAARLFGVPVAEVTPAQREQAKLYLFLKIFGATPETINQHLSRRNTTMNTAHTPVHSTLRDAILIKLRSLPVKRLARFAAISVNDDCRCVMGALYGSHKFYDKWVISERIDGVIRHRWANDMVAEWARKRGLTHYHVLRLIEINDRDPNAHVPLKDYRAETPSERYQRVVTEVEAWGVEEGFA